MLTSCNFCCKRIVKVTHFCHVCVFLRYFWYRNNARLDENLPNILRSDPKKGTLEIDPATVFDEGYYQCFAANKYGKAASGVAFLQRAVISPFPARKSEKCSKTVSDKMINHILIST